LYGTEVKPSRGNNSFKLMFIEFAGFPALDRDDMSGVLLSDEAVFMLQKIACGQGRIHMKCDPPGGADVNVCEPGKLLGIAKQEFNLEARGVKTGSGYPVNDSIMY
jgi:hypothetical protein